MVASPNFNRDPLDNGIRVASIMATLGPQIHLYPPYRETDALDYAVRTGLVGLGAGLFSACVKNAYFSATASPWTVFSVYGSTIPIYGAAFGAYGFTKTALSNFRHKNDGWNEFAGGASGGFVWGIFRRQSLPNIIAVTVMAGTVFGIFSWAGGLGGFSTIYGVDIHQALEYRRKWRWYPTNKIPMEDYERAIGRKAHPEDFADINEILGDQELPLVPTDNVGYVPVSKPNQQWWKEILEKSNGAVGENKK